MVLTDDEPQSALANDELHPFSEVYAGRLIDNFEFLKYVYRIFIGTANFKVMMKFETADLMCISVL